MRTRVRIRAALAAATLAIAPVANADRATNLVFAVGVLDPVPRGQELAYRHVRQGPDADGFHSIADGRITLVVGPSDQGGDEVVVAMFDGQEVRSRTQFPADAGNPLVMAFLESTLRSTAQITGGSPFYLRNRIKEALRSGGEVAPRSIEVGGQIVEAHEVTFRPFVADANADRMGELSQLEIRFVVSESVPGGFIEFSASTPETDGNQIYRETVLFTALTDATN